MAHGCTCAILDNHSGEGAGWFDAKGKPVFWITADCPLHGILKRRTA